MKQVCLLAIDEPETWENSKWQELSTFQQILIRYNTQSKTRRSFLRTAAAAAASLLGTSSSQTEEELKDMNTALGSNLKDIEVAPDDGGGQYQGNPQSTGYTETGKDPVTGFGEAQVIASPGASLPPVSLNGRTATAGNGSLEVYDEDGNQIASFDKGTETIPLLTNGGSTVFGSDATGLYKHDVDSGTLEASFDDTGSQGALKILNGVIGVEADGAADFFDAEDLSRVSEVTNRGPTLRSLVFASGRNALYEDGKGVESVDPQTGEKRWSIEPFGNRVSNAGAATNGDVYVSTDSAGRAHIIDVADGSKLETLDIGEEPSVSSPVFDGEGGLLLASQKLHRYDLEDFSKDWEAPIDGKATTTTAFDNVAAVSSANGVALYDLGTGQEVDRALSDKPVSLHGMFAGDAIYSMSGGDLYEIPIERGQPSGSRPPEDTGFDIARTVSPNEVAPGEEVTITTELSGVGGPVSTSSSYEPQFDEAAVQSVTVDGDPANPVLSEATPNGSTVTLSDVGTEATVTTIEELTAPQETDLTYEITGEATSGETTTKFNPLSIPVTEPQSVVERYDTDNNGNISITELGAAGSDFASGELSITELGEIGAAFASSSSS
jgi:hypothetical protein